MPVCVLALSPFSATLLFHLNVLNNADSFLATLSSLDVILAMSCFSFWSEVWILPLVACMSSYLALDEPRSMVSSTGPEPVEGFTWLLGLNSIPTVPE